MINSRGRKYGSTLHPAFTLLYLSCGLVLIHSVFKNVTMIGGSNRLPIEIIE
jgi:hypothetical protein